MIIGVVLNNIKSYNGSNYIPISLGQRYCGLVGINGIGKSGVLEALDSFFNPGRKWNINLSSDTSQTAFVIPVFMLSKELVFNPNSPFEELRNCRHTAEELSNYAWLESESNNSASIISKDVFNHVQLLNKEYGFNKDTHLLLPIGFAYEDGNINPSFGTFDFLNLDEHFDYRALAFTLRNSFQYIFVHKYIDYEAFTQLATKEIQILMGETLGEALKQLIPMENINLINQDLDNYTQVLSDKLPNYEFKSNSSDDKLALTSQDIYSLIVETYFNKKKLHKKQGENGWLEIGRLSSGEKQQAIIDVAYSFLQSRSVENLEARIAENLIIAIDEPETSLHVSACFDQFSKLFEISQISSQLIFATHWYGFIPIIPNGSVSIIGKENNKYFAELLDISRFREDIRKRKEHNKDYVSRFRIPFYMQLKSLNDYIQTVLTSLLDTEKKFLWLICEGTTDKLYIEKYLKVWFDLNPNSNIFLRVVAAGGIESVIETYENLMLPIRNFDVKNINGGLFCLIDTDENYQERNIDDLTHYHLYIKRLAYTRKGIKLVGMSSTEKTPIAIEDCLVADKFYESLKEFLTEYENDTQYKILLNYLGDMIDNKELKMNESVIDYFELYNNQQIRDALNHFFSINNNKYRFAERYCNKITNAKKEVPNWIRLLADRLNSK